MDALMHSLLCEAVEDAVVDDAINTADPAIASTPEKSQALSAAVADSEDIPDEEDIVNAPDVADDINDYLDDEMVPDVPDQADMPDDDIDLDSLEDPEDDADEDEPDTISTGDDGASVVGPEIPTRVEVTDPDEGIPDWAKDIQVAIHDKSESEAAPTTLEQVVTLEDRLMACESLDQFLTLDHKFNQTITNPEDVNAEAQPTHSAETEFTPKEREVRSELNDSRN